jgi:hypothetical protein
MKAKAKKYGRNNLYGLRRHHHHCRHPNDFSLNVVVWCSVLLLRIPDVSGSSLGTETGYPD